MCHANSEYLTFANRMTQQKIALKRVKNRLFGPKNTDERRFFKSWPEFGHNS
jgi:hypothetical protein